MKKQKITEIIEEQVDHTSKLCDQISPEFDKEALHKFRVSVKNLRSFLRLLRMHSHDKSLKISKKVKRLYHIAGAIRDAQLESDLIKDKQLNLPTYTDKLQKIISSQKTEWKKNYHKKYLQKLGLKLSRFKYDTLPAGALADFFNLRLKFVSEIRSERSPTDNQVHFVRKQVKDIIYTSEIADKKWKTVKKLIRAIPIKQLDYLADVIGQYNDNRVALEHLVSFTSHRLNQEEENTIRNVCETEAAKLIEEKKNIIAIWNGTITPLEK